MCGDASFTDILGFLASRKPRITTVGLWLDFHIWFLVLRCGWRDQGYVTSGGPFYMATKGASWTGHWRGRDHSCIRHHIAVTVWWFQVRLTPEESYLHLTVQSGKIKQGGFINYLQGPAASKLRIKDTKKSAFVSRQDRVTTLYNDIQSWYQKASNCFKIKTSGSQFWLRKSNIS